jgi:hypothetical protein
MNEKKLFGYGRKPQYYTWSTPLQYHLFSANKEPKYAGARKAPAKKAAAKGKKKTVRPPGKLQYDWSQEIPFHVRAMTLAGETLFIAGPPNLVDEEEAYRRTLDKEMQTKLAEQALSLQGHKGALLWAVATSDGKKISEVELDAPPAWDGMAAANGRLYMTTVDGKVVCFGAK